MTGWLEIMVVAFTAQLAVLPGEKVQFIIAGLSTRYNPWVVVSAAGSAFAGWTALEIWFGSALKGALPQVYLDAFTAALFLVFAVLLVRSAPDRGESPAETDGGMMGTGDLDVSVFGREVPDALGGFLPIFVMMVTGEFGDKTQLVTIGLAAQYGATPAIWAGEMLGVERVADSPAHVFGRSGVLVALVQLEPGERVGHDVGLGAGQFDSLGIVGVVAAEDGVVVEPSRVVPGGHLALLDASVFVEVELGREVVLHVLEAHAPVTGGGHLLVGDRGDDHAGLVACHVEGRGVSVGHLL